eukprot:16435525-Heterocapsa_arctica.AAC.1
METTGVPKTRRKQIPRPVIASKEISGLHRKCTETTLMNQKKDTVQGLDQVSHLFREKRRGKRLHARIGRMLQTRPTPPRPISHSKCMHVHIRCVPIACARSSSKDR